MILILFYLFIEITPFNKDWNIASFSDRKGFLPTNYVKVCQNIN
jgi:hypothetical protein